MGAVLIGLGVGCEGEKLTPSGEPEAAPRPPPVLTEIRLPHLKLEEPIRFGTEFRGLATMALELGLSDLPGVIVRVPGDAAPPSVLLMGSDARRQVDARFSARGQEKELELELELCIAGVGCESHTAVGTREAPWGALGDLLDGAAVTLGADVSDAVATAWRMPGSKDPYAELITGRGAATFYGLLPPPALPGDRRQDPVTRAMFIDPRQPLAHWTIARWDMASTVDGGRAAAALRRASLERPSSPLITADLATLLTLTDHADQALLAWEDLILRSPGDPRYLEPYARALLAVGRAKEARAVLDGFPAEFYWDPRVAALRVAVVEAVDGTASLDPLLEHWQRTDTRAVEPVRRRIDLRVQSARYEEAVALVGALRMRAPGPQTDALETALLTAVGRPLAAAERAPDEVAARLRARAEGEADPGAVFLGLPDDDADALIARAVGALWRNAPNDALNAVVAVLALAPDRADAWVVRARALERLGRSAEASNAWTRAWDLDPALEGGPVSPERIASTFQYVRAEPAIEEVEVTGGEKGPEL